MSIALRSFIANLSNTARPNRFSCTIVPPPDLGLDFDLSIMPYFVQGATLPDRTVGEIELKYYGMTLKVAGNESLSDLTITFLNVVDEANKLTLREFFEKWANVINNRADSTKGYMHDLFTGSSVTVTQLGGRGEELSKYAFVYIYPKIVSEIELNMESNDSSETFQVTFGYSYWNSIPLEDETMPTPFEEDF